MLSEVKIECNREKHPLRGKGLQYAYPWSVHDWYGRVHLRKNANKFYPVPGTQTNKELEGIEKRDADHARFEKALGDFGDLSRKRDGIRNFMVDMGCRLDFNQNAGKSIEGIADTLQQKHEILRMPRIPSDTKHQMKRFFESCCAGRSQYIGFAVTIGYREIDYQDPHTGDSGMHVTCRKGDLDTTEELLKYKANSDLKNRLGNYPLHECWAFHETNQVGRPKEVRLAQENKSSQLLHKILSYGGFVNVQDQAGNTALHMAVARNHLRAVLLLMGFKANPHLKNEYGESAVDFARRFRRHEIVGIFTLWEHIARAMVGNDFSIGWSHFMKDYTASISTEKAAEETCFDLNMEINIKRLDRTKRTGYPIDDPLLVSAFADSRKDGDLHIPRPWEQEWRFFQKYCDDYGIVDPLLQLDMVDENGAYKKGKKKKAQLEREMLAEVEKEEQERLRKQRFAAAGIAEAPPSAYNPFEGSRPGTGNMRPYSRGLFIKDAARGLPPKRAPDDRPRTREGTPGVRRREDGLLQVELTPKEEPRLNSPGMPGFGGTFDGMFSDSLEQASVSSLGAGSFLALDNESMNEQSLSHAEEEDDEGSSAVEEAPRPKSGTMLRRLHSAQVVKLDGKFTKFTRRPATQSVMFLSLRTPDAPYEGTEEEGNTRRILSCQGPEFEAAATVSVLNSKFGFKPEPPIDGIGAYSEAILFSDMNPREALYSTLLMKPMTTREAAEAAVMKAAKVKPRKDQLKKDRIDLVSSGERPRYVDKALIPPARKLTQLDLLVKNAEAIRQKSTNDEIGEAGADIADAIIGGEDKEAMAKLTAGENELWRLRKKKLLQKAEVTYGKYRMTNTHNCRAKLEYPYEACGMFYSNSLP